MSCLSRCPDKERRKIMKEDISDKLIKIIEAAGKLEPGTITHIEVKHETGCKALKTHRLIDCTCHALKIEQIGQ